MIKNPPANTGDTRDMGLIPGCSCGTFVVIDVPELIQYYQLKFTGDIGVPSWCSIVLEF